MDLHFTLLDEKANLNEFDCEEDELNLFLKNLALLFQRRHFGVTVVCSNSRGKIVGYYTLCPAYIRREELPEKILTGPRPNPIPAFRICRLAVDKNYQAKGHGKMLFVHALRKCLDQAAQIGGSIILIDAKHERAKSFYEHFGFTSLPEKSLMLLQTIKYIERHFVSK